MFDLRTCKRDNCKTHSLPILLSSSSLLLLCYRSGSNSSGSGGGGGECKLKKEHR